jgi:hypothetical protein
VALEKNPVSLPALLARKSSLPLARKLNYHLTLPDGSSTEATTDDVVGALFRRLSLSDSKGAP